MTSNDGIPTISVIHLTWYSLKSEQEANMITLTVSVVLFSTFLSVGVASSDDVPEFQYMCYTDLCTFPIHYCDSQNRRCYLCTKHLCEQLESTIPLACRHRCTQYSLCK